MTKLLQLLIILLSVSIWYGLAMVGQGGFAVFFAHPARMALVIIGVFRSGVGMLSEAGLYTGEREDAASLD